MAVKKSYVKDGVLYCFYEIANFDEVISQALKEHGLEAGKIQIICQAIARSGQMHPRHDECLCLSLLQRWATIERQRRETSKLVEKSIRHKHFL